MNAVSHNLNRVAYEQLLLSSSFYILQQKILLWYKQIDLGPDHILKLFYSLIIFSFLLYRFCQMRMTSD